jgi:hypothetical protein
VHFERCILIRKSFSEEIEGRKIIIHTQRTQTIKICTSANSPKEYEKYYRIPANSILDDKILKDKINNKVKTLKELDDFIKNKLNGNREPKREQSRSTMISTSNYSINHDSELRKIKNAVENSINKFIDEFIQFPYLHRVEHSIHTQLFYVMMKNPYLSQQVFMGDGKTKTSLVHKEWPWPLTNNAKRGTFDFAVLTPEYLKKDCPNIHKFCDGHFCPPIIIEIGLNYGYSHLIKDKDKISKYLKQGGSGYLIHLERERSENADTEKIIENVNIKGIKTAYALIVDKKIRYKYVNAPSIIQK